MTSSAKAAGRFGKEDFVYVAQDDVYRCPAGERLTYRFTTEEAGKMLRRYWTTACETYALKAQCTPGKEPARSVSTANIGSIHRAAARQGAVALDHIYSVVTGMAVEAVSLPKKS
jgi:hypothetical protein